MTENKNSTDDETGQPEPIVSSDWSFTDQILALKAEKRYEV